MTVIEMVEQAPKWTDDLEIAVHTGKMSSRFVLVVSNDLAGTKLVAVKWPGKRRGKWMRFVDFAQTNAVANFLDSLVAV